MAKRKVNEDGMRYPSVDSLLEKVDSKYKLAYAAAKRAKIIDEEQGYVATENTICAKPVGQALEEILEDKVKITFVNTSSSQLKIKEKIEIVTNNKED
ncbi:MAG: DNA-directed RNA polymerase subunit omega [Anaeroplasmataceae bacterium]